MNRKLLWFYREHLLKARRRKGRKPRPATALVVLGVVYDFARKWLALPIEASPSDGPVDQQLDAIITSEANHAQSLATMAAELTSVAVFVPNARELHRTAMQSQPRTPPSERQ
jgi:hypothetical protein